MVDPRVGISAARFMEPSGTFQLDDPLWSTPGSAYLLHDLWNLWEPSSWMTQVGSPSIGISAARFLEPFGTFQVDDPNLGRPRPAYLLHDFWNLQEPSRWMTQVGRPPGRHICLPFSGTFRNPPSERPDLGVSLCGQLLL